jgi:putative peptidoglycan lipid II flippase
VIPASIVLIFGGGAIISVLFQHGRFSYQNTLGAASALTFYSIGLLAYSAVRITVPVFYAFKETAKPIVASIASVAANISLCYLLMGSLGFKGLALAASMAGFLNLLILIVMLKSRLPELRLLPEIKPLAKIIIINAILAVIILFWRHYLSFDLQNTSLSLRIINLLILLVGAIIIYLVMARLARIEQLTGLQRIFKRI